MILVSTLYDEYIDRPKLTEQKKKNPVEYIVPPPSRGVGTTSKLLCKQAPLFEFVDEEVNQ